MGNFRISFIAILRYACGMIKPGLIVLAAFVALLTACDNKAPQADVGNFVSDIVKDVNKDIIKEIGKKYPLPEQVVINNAHNDTVNYTTTLSMDKVVDFYRQAYSKQGVPEIQSTASPTSDSTTLAFGKPGDKSVYIQIVKDGDGSRVHLESK